MKTKLTTNQSAQERSDTAAVKKLLRQFFQDQYLRAFNDCRQSFRRLKFWQANTTSVQLDLLNTELQKSHLSATSVEAYFTKEAIAYLAINKIFIRAIN